MSARRIAPLVLIAAAAVASGWYVYERRKPRPLVLGGTLEAHTVEVGSLVGGRVRLVHTAEGAHVKAGDLLVTLETDVVDHEIAEARAALAMARAELDKVVAGPRSDEVQKAAAIAANDERERRRLQALAAQGVIARSLYEDAATK
ncbi:MAG TPA: biotin/lipoyl-binding protein, partial [Thermoanaerobaculia bacterium]|nr:biotin/lipoyl-binding protein [Thermoanaerobaculia bacterium]